MEQEVRVQMTLSVNATIDKPTLESRIRALIDLNGEMALMEIKIQEEAEIYGND
jgi:hypothetical protein